MPTITLRNIMDHVRMRQISIREDIKASVKRKLVSLKIDVPTRMKKSILGINLQIFKSTLSKTEIVVKTLGMIQLFESHTGLYLKNKIVEIVQEYGIELDQIFSITSDNGKNMVKAIELINDDATEKSKTDDDKDEDFMELLDSMAFPNVQLVRCAAHTLQLCVYDVSKQSEISQQISTCRQMCKVLQTGKYKYCVFLCYHTYIYDNKFDFM
ncbi:uncharacterized protein LOC111077103 [Drosophila obscura]|uniref:uncharacterized protein LOC111077103 n=1 Tax=Drosophila obscura TaxID=7282 RepID=UPI001BB25CC5|nr:uncharacterized protein LOC111077103 [Drosophila obscura]